MMGILMDLSKLKQLMVQYTRERGNEDDCELARRLLLSDFLLWLQEKERIHVEKTTPRRAGTKADRFIN